MRISRNIEAQIARIEKRVGTRAAPTVVISEEDARTALEELDLWQANMAEAGSLTADEVATILPELHRIAAERISIAVVTARTP